MKLAKKISKGIALCAALAIMGTMGGVITSCSNGSEDTNPVESDDPPAGKDPADPEESALELTSIIEGIVAEENVWNSGTSITKTDDVYVVVAGKGWDKEGMASIPVSFAAGDLDGYEFIVLDGVDTSGFELRDDNDEYPSIELKITYKVGEEEKSKIISATKLLKDNKIEIPLANVEEDFLKKGSQIMLSFRGTGTVKIKDISKAKAKVATTNPGSSTTNPGSSTTNPGSSTTNPGTSTTDPGTSEDPETSAKTITYSVTADALTADDTMLVFKYNRSAAGAKELVIIENCGIVVKYNGTEIKTIDKLEFALDEYGAYFDGDRSEDTRKEYKIKVGIATKVKKGDTVVVEYKEGVGTITGEGKDAEAVKTLVVALIDTNEKAGYNEETQEGGYYKELAENVYRPLF